jgi:hypothetical protein
MMTDIHSCSYYCDRPECIKAQRDELRERLAQPRKPMTVIYSPGQLAERGLTHEDVVKLIKENT